MADEVYQENVYGDAPAFISFKKIVHDLKSTIPVVSFHSVSKGFTGECGLRGGYFELTNVSEQVKEQLIKLASVSLCSNVLGQIAVGLMVNPPVDGKELKAYEDEKAAKLSSLERRANEVAKALDALDGVSCVQPQGAMYLFPSITLPDAALAAAGALKLARKASWKPARRLVTAVIWSSGGRKVVRKCQVPFFWPKPEPGTTTRPVDLSLIHI